MTLIAELQEQLAAAAGKVGAATVSIGRDHRGAGIVVGHDRVLTNAHNLRDRTVQVTFGDDRVEQGAIVGADPARDLVVLAVPTGDVEPVEWSDEPPALGSFVVAVARDGVGVRATLGTVSQESRSFRGPGGRPITAALEHTAPLARGSSGGPLADLDGRLVAVNTHRLGKGFTAAQPATAALHALVDELIDGRFREPLTLGVEVAPPHAARRLRAAVGLEPRDGLLVRGVVDGSPAANAGVRSGDLIVTIGGESVAGTEQLFAALSAHTPSEPMVLGLVRGAEELTVEVLFTTEAAAGSTPDGGQPAD